MIKRNKTMKKLIVVLAVIFVPFLAMADDILLDADQALTVTTYRRITDWEITRINEDQQILIVKYRRAKADGTTVNLDGSRGAWKFWTCENMADNPETPEDETSTCFSDIFGFNIRAQDVGTSIGGGLKQLIRIRMLADIAPGNTGDWD